MPSYRSNLAVSRGAYVLSTFPYALWAGTSFSSEPSTTLPTPRERAYSSFLCETHTRSQRKSCSSTSSPPAFPAIPGNHPGVCCPFSATRKAPYSLSVLSSRCRRSTLRKSSASGPCSETYPSSFPKCSFFLFVSLFEHVAHLPLLDVRDMNPHH